MKIYRAVFIDDTMQGVPKFIPIPIIIYMKHYPYIKLTIKIKVASPYWCYHAKQDHHEPNWSLINEC